MGFWAVLYLLILLLIGIAAAKRNREAGDFFLAGRRLTLVPLTFTAMASIMSGFVFVGGPGLFYQVGFGSFWITISSSFTGALICWLLAKPLFRMASREDCLTIPDVIWHRFGCRWSSGLAAGAILAGVLGYLALQLKALAVLLGSVAGLPSDWAMVAGLAILVFYASAGGVVGSVYSDVVQGVLMMWVATLIFYFLVDSSGGTMALIRELGERQGEWLSPWGTVGPLTALSWFALFSIGSLGQPHVVNRLMMVRDLNVFRWFPLALAVAMLICGLVWLAGGIGSRLLVLRGELPPLQNPDEAIMVVLGQMVPPWLAPMALLAVVAAIMSTADSFANVGAGVLTRDLPRAFGFCFAHQVFWGRIFSLMVFAGAGWIAFRAERLVALLGVFSFGTFAATLVPVLAIGLNWDRPGPVAARASILVGLISGIGFESAALQGWMGSEIPSGLVALGLSLFTFLLVGKVRSDKDRC